MWTCESICATHAMPRTLIQLHVLTDRDANMTFKVFHVKSTGASLEYTVDHSATHVKWRVSSLSPVGPVVQSEETVFHHGAVILYKAIDHNPSLSFRVYVATNNESFIKVRPMKVNTKCCILCVQTLYKVWVMSVDLRSGCLCWFNCLPMVGLMSCSLTEVIRSVPGPQSHGAWVLYTWTPLGGEQIGK